ncbi:hypothetical protein [Streptomyces diastatochromogenes]|uniref:Uncharacterized protein n=1 Tax=Streptomyces diastatochromogenes TaxID=42236 RepID=A0A233RQ12_STRDA|nr:hypothetical protein [Streptomyces diastatochromogenes]OXY85479.1 hypothetical protein BEK98_45695 [Streptomyces diastatochromogenes]
MSCLRNRATLQQFLDPPGQQLALVKHGSVAVVIGLVVSQAARLRELPATVTEEEAGLQPTAEPG